MKRTATTLSPYFKDALAAGLTAAVTGGFPSTVFALCTGRDPLEATRAAGAMLIDPRSGDLPLFAAATVVHVAISLFWTAILAKTLPHRHVVAWSTIAAAAIAILDLCVIGQLFPTIESLAFLPQLADHLAWGATVGFVLSSRRRSEL
jgi:hypothetical protein